MVLLECCSTITKVLLDDFFGFAKWKLDFFRWLLACYAVATLLQGYCDNVNMVLLGGFWGALADLYGVARELLDGFYVVSSLFWLLWCH